MFCTKCGSELPEGVRHCYVCGAAVRQLPPLRTGQGFAAGQPGYNTPASPASPPYGPAGQPGQNTPEPPASPSSGPDGQPDQPQNSPAYQSLPSQGLPRPAWPPSPEDDSTAALAAPRPAYQAPPPPGPAYAAGPARPGAAYQQSPPLGAGRPYPPPPPASPAYYYPAYYHASAADSPDTVSTLDWVLSNLLVLFVPLVSLIMLCVWAFAAGTKPSKRSWARAMLILFVVFFALFFALCVYYAATDPAFLYS